MAKKRTYKPKEGDRIKDWSLVRPLGTGGNAAVWRAADKGGSEVAIKILKTGERYRRRRFAAEVTLLLHLGERTGVLPIIDADLPEDANAGQPSWLAMPIAEPMRSALGVDAKLETIVEAVAVIAETLASLAEERIWHRDIKPDNLYCRGGNWEIGDFGLAQYPDKARMTDEGRKLGPLFFMADEMIENADKADAGPADVYSLAKTLWVLATGQNYPPQGQIQFDIRKMTLSTYAPHMRARIIDRLLDLATHPLPEARPTMKDFAAELRAWLAPPKSIEPDDISDLEAELATLVEPSRRNEAARLHLIEEAHKVVVLLDEKLKPIVEAISKAIPDPKVGPDKQIFLISPAGRKTPNILSTDSACVTSTSSFAGRPIALISGVGVRLTDDGRLDLVAAHFITSYYRNPEFVWNETRTVAVGSAVQAIAIDDLISGLVSNHRKAVLQFMARMK